MSNHDRLLCDNCRNSEFGDFEHTCVHESIDKNDIWMTKFRINSWPRWDYSMEEATLTFSQEEGGRAEVICDMQVVGTVHGDSWEWSWGNPNLPKACKTLMAQVHDFGEEKNWPKLTSLFLESDDYLGWACSAVARHILNGVGVYRCPNSGEPGNFVYLVILKVDFVS